MRLEPRFVLTYANHSFTLNRISVHSLPMSTSSPRPAFSCVAELSIPFSASFHHVMLTPQYALVLLGDKKFLLWDYVGHHVVQWEANVVPWRGPCIVSRRPRPHETVSQFCPPSCSPTQKPSSSRPARRNWSSYGHCKTFSLSLAPRRRSLATRSCQFPLANVSRIRTRAVPKRVVPRSIALRPFLVPPSFSTFNAP